MNDLTLTLADGFFYEMWFGGPNGDGPVGYSNRTDFLFMWLWWFCTIWFVGLMGAMIYFVIRYRRRKGVPGERSAAHNTPMEIAWTIIPSLFLVYIFFEGFWGYIDGQVAETKDQVELNVTGQQWVWNFEYPNGAGPTVFERVGAMDSPVVYVPEDTPIKLRMSSADVIHSFWLPDFRNKQDVFPNRYTSFWFKPAKLDPDDPTLESDTYNWDANGDGQEEAVAYKYRDHLLFCAEYCGQNHSDMAAIIRVVPKARYDAFLARPIPPGATPPERGAILYKMKGCASCHSVDGSAGTGPSWKDLYGAERAFSNAAGTVADDNYIRESILVPAAKVVEGYPNQMVSYQGRVNDQEISDIIAYMKSISTLYKGPPPSDEPEGDEGNGDQ